MQCLKLSCARQLITLDCILLYENSGVFVIYCVLVGISTYKFIAIIFIVIKKCSKNHIVDNINFLFWGRLGRLMGKVGRVLNRKGSTYLAWCTVLKILYLLPLGSLIIKLREII